MRVLMAPDDGGCGFYRLREPARVLADEGVEIEVMDPDINWPIDARYDPPRFASDEDIARLTDDERERITGPPDADVVVFQRLMRDWRVAAIPALQARGIAVVVDVDDAMHAVGPAHPAYRDSHPHWHLMKRRSDGVIGDGYDPTRLSGTGNHWLEEACALADLVTCTTPALARHYARHGRVRVLPNRIPAWYLDVQALPVNPGRVTVGWSGIIATHPGDLEVTRGAIGQVVRETGAVFHVLGNTKGVKQALRLDGEPSLAEWCPLEDYPRELGRLDVGVVPLADNLFNAAKSRLKGMEMAATGVPFVASARADYLALRRLGIGELAATRTDWYRKVTRLVKDESYRADQAAANREAVAGLTYEQHAHEWLDAWRAARDARTSTRQAA